MKTKSYLFLTILAIILVFILGVRYGQKVEKSNLSISLGTKEFVHSGCAVSFIYPAWWQIEKQSSQSADFFYDHKMVMSLNCNKAETPAKSEIDGFTPIQTKNKKTGTVTTINLNDSQKNWRQLIEKTLKFISPTPQ